MLNSVAIFFCSFFSLFLFRKFAHIINLVDTPSERKNHRGSVPLVGGLSIFVVVFSYLYVFPDTISSPYLYLLCAGTLLLVGVLDDYMDMSFKIRLLIQISISIIMMAFAGLVLIELGQILGPFSLNIGLIGYVATIITVVGAINAFNMVDGIDGLLGGLSVVTFASLGALFYINGQFSQASFCLVIIAATLPYILLNLGLPFGQRFKVFMGDAGSTVIGFTVVWLLIYGSQGEIKAIRPVTALWIAALPIIDAVSTIMRRIKKGHSPFKPDREHLHHILQRLGIGSKGTLAVICFIAAVLAVIGVLSEMYKVSEYLMFFLFLLVFYIYYSIICRIWRITVKLRRFFGITKKKYQKSSC
ncbi:UDP-N-acetylglucosamine--undecaprenyl-phosphate N-acetylglucosaminephosphotransferase [Pseudoalteromonas tunicata]|nr:UDP-N-acetylglucosamine--undecaprenyl-phosphate N-acetylglucosaminephosphotransferase [Pseudoalteromonas tunicata]MDP5213580.1 UDP-N-acetylglucosamine--undecaprenyl-phosphate N-acetylglucosaminephosphotransferase [Pseudoalteromonas tunicata]